MGTVTGRIHSFESFGLVDGPGVRCVVFLQGCRMRCKYCHNPDSWKIDDGEEWEPAALVRKALRFRPYWKEKGGVTVSGGEALLQTDFVTEFFRLLKKEKVNTCLDISGNPFRENPEYLEKFDRLLAVTDLVILDIKEMDEEKHKALTGWTNKNILRLAQYLSDHGIHMWIRHVLVPGLTDDEQGLKDLASFIGTLKTVDKVEILPYHTLGVFKYENLGIPYPLDGVPAPTEEQIRQAEAICGAGEFQN